MGPTKNTNTKRDTRSVEQLEEARRFKKPKLHQPDDDDPNNEDDDDDYKEEHKGFDEDDDDDDEFVGAPVIVSRTQSSNGSTSRHMIECEDDDVGK
jgi:ABC-type Zn2+ transport system substrate-binding protein/surface adhesin